MSSRPLIKRALIVWLTVSMLSLAGFIRVAFVGGRLDAGEKAALFLSAGSLLLLGILGGLAWRADRQVTRLFSREGSGSILLFFLCQPLAGILAASAWLSLRFASLIQFLQLNAWAWTFLIFLVTGMLFLLLRGKVSLSVQGAAPGLLAFGAAMLLAHMAQDVVGLFLKHPAGPAIAAFLPVFEISLPWLIFDLLLLATLVSLSESPASDQAREPALSPARKNAARGGRLKKVRETLSTSPWLFSLLIAVVFWTIHLALFRPGYAVNDDISMIAIASGYLGGKPVPFLVFSNILLGLLLNLLYGFHTRVNWEIWLFLAVDLLSAWGLLYLILSRPMKRSLKFVGGLIVLVCASIFLVEITFTTTAGFASLAGFCLVLAAVLAQSEFNKRLMILGGLLVFTGSLIRIESTLVALLMISPVLLLGRSAFRIRNILISFAIVGLLVSGGYLFDRLYLRSSPDWHAFDIYNQVRSNLQDTHRLASIDGAIQVVGWSTNDLKMFAHWFFPDPKTYSLQNLQYLVEHVPNTTPGIWDAILFSFGRLFSLTASPYVLLILAIWLGPVMTAPQKRALLSLAVLTAAVVALSIYLAWTEKLPNRVIYLLLVDCAIVGFFIQAWSGSGQTGNHPADSEWGSSARLAINCMAVLLVAASGLALGRAALDSRANVQEQVAYRQILADLDVLQGNGKIPPGALILSPAYGIPLVWSDPLVLDFPRVHYLEMGWLTFSPVYDQILRQHEVGSLPAGFYQKQDLFLMASQDMKDGIQSFIKEHARTEVDAKVIYAMPNQAGGSEYNGIYLFQFESKK